MLSRINQSSFPGSPRTTLKANSPRPSSRVASGPSTGAFDKASYEAKRLALDDQARREMSVKSSVEASSEAALPGSVAGAWKWAVRAKVWDHLEEANIARPPRPCHHRIPNFSGADKAANLLASQPFFKSAQIIKVNPDTPQKPLRIHVLSANKKLLTPQPRLRTGFFSTLTRDKLPKSNDALAEAATSAGVAKYGVPIDLDEKITVDLIVVGSTAVTLEGARIGKGEGFAELEYGILRWMGAVDERTLIVTTVHDDQVLDPSELPRDKLLEHDVPVDIIVTPTRVLFTNTTIPKPAGILWEKLSPQKLAQIRILRELKARIEKETGQTLPTGPDEVLPPLAERNKMGPSPRPERKNSRTLPPGGDPVPVKESPTVFLSNCDYHVSSAQIQDWIEDVIGLDTVKKITMLQKGHRGRVTFTGCAVVDLESVEAAKLAIERLDGSEFEGRKIFLRFDRFTSE